MKDTAFGYTVFVITLVMSAIFLLSGCVMPSRYDVELANRQNDNMLNVMQTIEAQEDIFIGFLMLLEKRIMMLEEGRMYMVAPNTSLIDVIPQYLEPVEEDEEFGTGGG